MSWSSRAVDNAFAGRGDTALQAMVLEPGAAALLTTSLASSVLSTFLFITSDRNLFNAVHIYNNNAGHAQRTMQLKMGLTFVSINSQSTPAIGFRASW